MTTHRVNLEGPEPMPVSERPLCRACGKRLRPYFHKRAEGEPNNWTHYKKLVGYGGYGDNLFCGLNCGYLFAVRSIAEARRKL